MATKKIIVKKGQCTIDIALQYYGSMSGLPSIAKLNGFGLLEQLTPGQELVVDDVSNNTTKYLTDRNITIAAADDTTLFTGIGWMEIENDFKVS